MIRIYIFLVGFAVIALGIFGKRELPDNSANGFLLGALTLGGALLICGGFTFRMKWHGVIGAGVIALLGLGRGVLNFSGFASYITGDQTRGITPVLELIVAILCAFVLMRIFGAWQKERSRKIREGEKAELEQSEKPVRSPITEPKV